MLPATLFVPLKPKGRPLLSAVRDAQCVSLKILSHALPFPRVGCSHIHTFPRAIYRLRKEW